MYYEQEFGCTGTDLVRVSDMEPRPDQVEDPIPMDDDRTHQLENSDFVVRGVHRPTQCEGHPCAIHSPSDHLMRAWPQYWREDRGMMERICPHGIGHPDPDYISYVERVMSSEDAWAAGVHGCDGCCTPHERSTTNGN